jgi:transcriptional pleiotropic regulator of transition state genes
MISIGVTRPIDSLGRVVIPKEIRTRYDLKEDDRVEIYVDGELIVLKKYEPTTEHCVICGEMNDLIKTPYDNKVCTTCAESLGVILKQEGDAHKETAEQLFPSISKRNPYEE